MNDPRARWAQASPTAWLLKRCARDGGAVLGSIERAADGWYWICGERDGGAPSKSDAQRAVRRTLRVAGANSPVSPPASAGGVQQAAGYLGADRADSGPQKPAQRVGGENG